MKLSLAEKGPIEPVPVLREPFERVSRTVASWPDMIAATHWHFMRRKEIDGADFYRSDEELGHIHLDGEIHLACPRDLTAPLLAAGLARRFAFSGINGGWAEFTIRTQADADHAIWLFRLNYDLIGGTPLPELLARIAERAAPVRRAG